MEVMSERRAAGLKRHHENHGRHEGSEPPEEITAGHRSKSAATIVSAASLPFSAACERNKDPILNQLRFWLPIPVDEQPLKILEVGSGSGQHAVHMTRHLEGVHWQPSELESTLMGLRSRLELEGRVDLAPGSRILEPVVLDVNHSSWPQGPFDLVFTANTLHIMAAASIPPFLAGVAGVLRPGGPLLIYGPFRDGKHHGAESNAAFDAHLRSIDPAMGVRDAREIRRLALEQGLQPVSDETMPANNRMLVFRLVG